MLQQFNADEVFEIAQQLERNGAKFYREAADATSDEDLKNLFIQLAKMERVHENYFAKLRAEFTGPTESGGIFDPHGDPALYLKSLADTKVFFDKEIDTSSAVAIFKTAITAEKDSIVFYLGMKEAVPQELGKEKIDAIIREEMDHLRILSERLAVVGD